MDNKEWKWIKCSDELPPLETRVLLFPAGDEVIIGSLIKKEENLEWVNDYDGDSDIGSPLYWAFIPNHPHLYITITGLKHFTQLKHFEGIQIPFAHNKLVLQGKDGINYQIFFERSGKVVSISPPN